MTQTITIEPVTRVEGHGKVTIHLDNAGRVAGAKFHALEFRGFEKFCEGRTFPEMPGITMRICGICPVSHMLASAKACDSILGVRIPHASQKLRRLINHAQFIQSHALSFFHLSAPDLLLGMESYPAERNVVGLLQKFPAFAMKGVKLRAFGQNIIRMLGGKSVHPPWAVPGGVRGAFTAEQITIIRKSLPEAFEAVGAAVTLLKEGYDGFRGETASYGDFPSLFIGMVTPEGGLEHYDGVLRVMDAEGGVIEPGLPAERYREIIAEAAEPFSYMKFPYYKPKGYDNGAGLYRVGPLARLNICDFAGTPRADEELRQFRLLGNGKPVSGSFHAHYARLIEILFSLEKITELIDDAQLYDPRLRAVAGVNERAGVGIVEAPRGTLIHEYHVDDCGIMKKANIIVATGHNNQAINKTIEQIAAAYMSGKPKITEGMMNRVEHGVRIYDPCLSCATHAVGWMPLHIRVFDHEGNLIEERTRD
jgi:NAD-reducing hydrogenase large subunit